MILCLNWNALHAVITDLRAGKAVDADSPSLQMVRPFKVVAPGGRGRPCGEKRLGPS